MPKLACTYLVRLMAKCAAGGGGTKTPAPDPTPPVGPKPTDRMPAPKPSPPHDPKAPKILPELQRPPLISKMAVSNAVAGGLIGAGVGGIGGGLYGHLRGKEVALPALLGAAAGGGAGALIGNEQDISSERAGRLGGMNDEVSRLLDIIRGTGRYNIGERRPAPMKRDWPSGAVEQLLQGLTNRGAEK